MCAWWYHKWMATGGHWIVFYDSMALGDIILVSYVHDPWLNMYIYIYINVCIYMFMILDGHWQSVCVCVCVWLIIMILVVWITACFFVLTCPHPSRFQFKHDNCVYMCVWFSNDDTCCLNYSMFFCSDLPSPSRFQCWHENSSLENEKKHVGKPSPNWKAKTIAFFTQMKLSFSKTKLSQSKNRCWF